MKQRFLARLRRFAAVLFLASAGIPALVEQLSHTTTPDLGLTHFENATQRHHADHCLSSMAPTERSTPNAAVPCLNIHILARADEPVPFVGLIGHQPLQPTRSRAPPRFIA